MADGGEINEHRNEDQISSDLAFNRLLRLRRKECQSCSVMFFSALNFSRHERIHKRTVENSKKCDFESLKEYWGKLKAEQQEDFFRSLPLVEDNLQSFIQEYPYVHYTYPSGAPAPEREQRHHYQACLNYLISASVLLDIVRCKNLPVTFDELLSHMETLSEKTNFLGEISAVYKLFQKKGKNHVDVAAHASFLLEAYMWEVKAKKMADQFEKEEEAENSKTQKKRRKNKKSKGQRVSIVTGIETQPLTEPSSDIGNEVSETREHRESIVKTPSETPQIKRGEVKVQDMADQLVEEKEKAEKSETSEQKTRRKEKKSKPSGTPQIEPSGDGGETNEHRDVAQGGKKPKWKKIDLFDGDDRSQLAVLPLPKSVVSSDTFDLLDKRVKRQQFNICGEEFPELSRKEQQEFPAGDSKSLDFDKEMKNIDRIPENRISLKDWMCTLNIEAAWVKIPYNQVRLTCRFQYIVRCIIREVATYLKKGIRFGYVQAYLINGWHVEITVEAATVKCTKSLLPTLFLLMENDKENKELQSFYQMVKTINENDFWKVEYHPLLMWSVDRFHFPSQVLVLIENTEQLKYLQVEIEWRKDAMAEQALENKGMAAGAGKAGVVKAVSKNQALENTGMATGAVKAVSKNMRFVLVEWQKDFRSWYDKKLKADKGVAKSFNMERFCNMPGAERFFDLWRTDGDQQKESVLENKDVVGFLYFTRTVIHFNDYQPSEKKLSEVEIEQILSTIEGFYASLFEFVVQKWRNIDVSILSPARPLWVCLK